MTKFTIPGVVRRPVLGLDLGGCVIARTTDPRDGLLSETPLITPAVDGVFEKPCALAALGELFDGRIVIISRAGPRVETASREWLRCTGALDRLRIDESALHFCRRPHPQTKRAIALEQGVTHQVDDDMSVLERSPAQWRFLFTAAGERHHPKNHNPGVVFCRGWQDTLDRIENVVW